MINRPSRRPDWICRITFSKARWRAAAQSDLEQSVSRAVIAAGDNRFAIRRPARSAFDFEGTRQDLQLGTIC
jgi:hypothetical protein